MSESSVYSKKYGLGWGWGTAQARAEGGFMGFFKWGDCFYVSMVFLNFFSVAMVILYGCYGDFLCFHMGKMHKGDA